MWKRFAFFITLLLISQVNLAADPPLVLRFTLMNALNDATIEPLDNGDIIYPYSYANDGRVFNIAAETYPASLGSVRFALNGPVQINRIENAAPYALFSDDAGDFFVGELPDGTYRLTATPYSRPGAKGTAGHALTIQFTVARRNLTCTSDLEVRWFEGTIDGYYNSEGQYLLFDLPENSYSRPSPVSYATYCFDIQEAGNYKLVGGVLGMNSNSDSFWVNFYGRVFDWHVPISESIVADDASDYPSNNPVVVYLPRGQVQIIIALRETFTQLDWLRLERLNAGNCTPIVQDFTLIDSTSDTPVPGYDPMPNGATLDLGMLPPKLNIRANTAPGVVGSVIMQLSLSEFRVETQNSAPYALFSDNAGDYAGWQPGTGEYLLTARAYAGANGTGITCEPAHVNFRVIEQQVVELQVDNFTDNPALHACTLEDGFDCSLRGAISRANAGIADDFDYHIILPFGTFQLTNTGPDEDGNQTGDLDVRNNVTITGAGKDQTIIEACPGTDCTDRVFDLSFIGVRLENLTVRNGLAANGGGILINYAQLTLENSRVANNRAIQDGGGLHITGWESNVTLLNTEVASNTALNNGGGVYADNNARITVHSSTLYNNTAGVEGGGLYEHISDAQIINSTVSGNTAGGQCGGLFGFDFSSGERPLLGDLIGAMIINSSTITNNSPFGLCIESQAGGMGDTILAGNDMDCKIGEPNYDIPIYYGINGYNITGPNCEQFSSNLKFTGPISELLAPLADNGGPTFTHALVPGSVAIDAGNPGFDPLGFDPDLLTDQRGAPRVSNGRVDIGAFEVETTGGAVVIVPGNSASLLREPSALTVEGQADAPLLRWTASEGAARYNVVVADAAGTILLDDWVEGDVYPLTTLTNGLYRWWVRAESGDTVSAWSTESTVEIARPVPALPAGLAVSHVGTQSTFNWPPTAHATYYQLWIGTPDEDTVHVAWYSADDLTCADGLCNITVELSRGDYVWYVQAWGAGGLSTGGLAGWAQGPAIHK
ncbi:MAG: hypothetical protein OHK0046_49570 [Anaerolineae bacterium]